MEEKVLETIKKYNLIENGDRLVLAVSGGPDSITMLDILNKLRANKNNAEQLKSEQVMSQNSKKPNLKETDKIQFEICVAHVNHLIREEAESDQKYVENYCKKNNIDFYSKSIDVQKLANNNKIGTEEAGRMVRYEFFDEVLEKTNSNKIALAHNKNDRAETIIMNMLRGSGISGLKGIEPKRGKYIRPIIGCERFEIENYCEEHKLEPRIDKTNFDNTYTRNKIRNIVIPYVKEEFNPNIVNTLERLSQLVCEEEEYIEKQVECTYKKLLENEELNNEPKTITLDLKEFNNQEKVIKSRVLLYTITRLLGTSQGIEKVHIEDVIKLCQNNIGNKFLTPNKKIKILVKNHKIFFIKQM